MEPVQAVSNNAFRNITDSQSLTDSVRASSEANSKPTVQLPTICFPAGTPGTTNQSAQPPARQPYVPGLEYRTTTYTQLQVAQTTFRYPPTPPIEMGDCTDRFQQQQPCPTTALSHLHYQPQNDSSMTDSKNAFPSLPTPPELVPISDLDSVSSGNASLSPQTCKDSYYRKQWASMEGGDMSHSGYLNGSQQSWADATSPSAMQQSSRASIPPAFLFPLPLNHQYGEGNYTIFVTVY